MISLPVKIGSVISDSDTIPSHQYAPDGSRIRYKKVAESTGKEVDYADIRKGYDAPDGGIVFLTDEEVAEAFGEISRTARILMTTDKNRVPDIAKSRPFLVQPDKGGDKAYALLVRGLTRTGKVAIIELGLRQRKRLAVVSPTAGGYLMLQQLVWAEDIKEPDFKAPAVTVSAEEEEMAATFIDTLSGDFDHSAFKDDSAAKLAEMITARAGQPGQVAGIPVTASPVKQAEDLLALMALSIAAATEKGQQHE
jgi:DNA end-binding protein Ku